MSADTSAPPTTAPPSSRLPSQTAVIIGLLVVVVALQPALTGRINSLAFQSWCTMFVAVVLQAVPFLMFGVLLAGVISVLLSERVLRAALPQRPALAVPFAGLAGAALPGCECASVPVAGSLVRRGVAPAAALTFLLAAPAINPVVLVSTAVAFAGRSDMVVARFVASLITSVLIGWLWIGLGKRVPMRLRTLSSHDHGETRLRAFTASVQHDFVHAGGFLVLGAMIAAGVNTFVPRSVIDAISGHQVWAILALALFAFLIAMCSEADAFVAVSLTAFSDTAKLAFLVVGPAIDVKLAALQAGYFGPRFAAVFAPVTFVVAIASAVLVAGVLL